MLGSIDCKKIVVLGNPSVGKTSIIQRYVHNKFQSSYAATLGFNIYTRYITIANRKVGLSIWDVGGQEAFRKFAFRYLLETDAAIFVTDVTKPETLESLKMWNDKLDQVTNRQIPKIVLLNKIDMAYDMEIVSDRIAELEVRSEFHGIVFASAKTGTNVIDIFSMIAKMLAGWGEEFGVKSKRKVNFTGAFDDGKLPILFFSSAECRSCGPILERIAKISTELPLEIKVINADVDLKTVQEHGIQSLPTTIIGSKTLVGASSEKIFRAIIADEYNRLVKQ